MDLNKPISEVGFQSAVGNLLKQQPYGLKRAEIFHNECVRV